MSTLKEYAAGKDWSGFMNRMAPQRVSQVKACKNLDEAVQLLHSWYLDYFGTRENCLALAREIRKKEAVPATVPPPAVQTPAPAAPAEAQPAAQAVAPVEAEKPKPEANVVTVVPSVPAPAPAAPTATTAPKPAEPEKIRCPQCGSMTTPGVKCEVCGASLPQKKEAAPAAPAPAIPAQGQKCLKCGATLVPPGTFCGQCGAAQATKPAAPAAASKPGPNFRQANNGGAKKRPSFGRIVVYLLLGACVLFTLRACAAGDFWRIWDIGQAPAATPATKSPTDAMTLMPTRTPTVTQTKTSEISRATEPADRIRDLKDWRILAFVCGGILAILAALLAFLRKKVLAWIAGCLALAAIVAGLGVWIALMVSPSTPTGTPTPAPTPTEMSKEQAKAIVATATAEAAVSATAALDPDLIGAKTVVAAKTASAEAAATSTPTATTKPAEPTKQAAAPSVTTKPAEPTKPAQPPVQGNARSVKITGELKALHKDRDEGKPILWNQIALEFFGANGQRIGDAFNLGDMQLLEFTVLLPKGAVQAKIWIGDDLGGKGWWNTWDCQPAPIGDGSIVLTITKKEVKPGPAPTKEPTPSR